MADPICRWRNTTVKQVCEFSEILPHKTMPKEEARDLIEKNWNQWDGSSNFFRTPTNWLHNSVCITRMTNFCILVSTMSYHYKKQSII